MASGRSPDSVDRESTGTRHLSHTWRVGAFLMRDQKPCPRPKIAKEAKNFRSFSRDSRTTPGGLPSRANQSLGGGPTEVPSTWGRARWREHAQNVGTTPRPVWYVTDCRTSKKLLVNVMDIATLAPIAAIGFLFWLERAATCTALPRAMVAITTSAERCAYLRSASATRAQFHR